MSANKSRYLDHEVSEQSESDTGYDSEAAELSKGARNAIFTGLNVKRRKSLQSESVESDGDREPDIGGENPGSQTGINSVQPQEQGQINGDHARLQRFTIEAVPKISSKKIIKNKDKKPGVIYLSSLPPYLKPSALRNLLTQRGFSPITRLFLTPASKAKSTTKKNSRQLYTEGWIEFADKKTARRCAEGLNAQIVGGKKSGFYYDDLWNMKYLKGMGWDELMAGIREEKREQEGRQDEERRTIARETKRFIEGVEEGKRIQGIKRKRSEKARTADSNGDMETRDAVKRTWHQFEVKGKGKSRAESQNRENINKDAKEVLGKIF